MYQESKDQKTYFLKIHAPWDVLATYAEVLKIKVPFKESDIPHGQDVPLEWLSHPFRLPEHIMRPQPDYFTYPFDKTKTDFFLINDKDTFFPPSTRNRIVSISSRRIITLLRVNPGYFNSSGQADLRRLCRDVLCFYFYSVR